jgi:collagenase-like PrtC family protease
VQRVQASGRRAVVATPRVLKPDEERLSTFYLRLRADALLVRSIGMLQSLSALGGAGAAVTLPGSTSGGTVRVPALYGDFSLNAANTLTAAHFLTAGLARLTPAHDLNAQQLAALARSVGPSAANQLEVVVHQHLPVFHTEHCVFARQLSEGRSFRDCGHPCETHALHLRDPQGQDHRVLADAGCRNTVFNAAAQSGAADVATLAAACVGGLRVELLDDPPHEVAPLLEAYRRLAEGRDAPKAVLAWLETRGDANGAKQGVTHGSLETRPERARADMKQTAAAGRNAAAGKGR